MNNPYSTPPPPRWARKRYVLPALALALLIGAGIGAGGDGGDAETTTDVKPLAASAAPTVTVTATATVTETPAAAEPEPAVTVTRTVTRTVKATETVTAEPVEDYGSDDSGTSGGSVYYGNCSEARAAGAAPVYAGDPGYGSHLDRDGDGVGCE